MQSELTDRVQSYRWEEFNVPKVLFGSEATAIAIMMRVSYRSFEVHLATIGDPNDDEDGVLSVGW